MSTNNKKSVTQIVDGKFSVNCSTKTFIAKVVDEKCKFSIDELKTFIPNSYLTNFRNCVLKKIEKKNVKIYTNLTIQINGVSDIEDLKNIFALLNLKKNYQVKCVMSNWTIKITKNQIDLVKTMDNLNDVNITAYFLRGYPLIIKYKENLDKKIKDFEYFRLSWNPETSSYTYNSNINEILEKSLEVTVLMFKSGNCIVSGPCESLCVSCISTIKNFLVEI